MSEVNPTEQKLQNNQNVEAYLSERATWMADAVEILTGNREGDPLVVFPAATEVRDDGLALDLSDEQENALREVAGRFGIGGEADVKSGAEHQILEGGKPWKIEAEAVIAEGAKTILFAGSPYRKIGQDEADYLRSKLPEDVEPAQDEFAMARQLAERQEGFVGLDADEILPLGYDISNNHSLVNETTGQLVRIGKIGETDVIMLRVDRENYIDKAEEDPNKRNKYRNQPDSAALLRIVSNVLAASGDETSSIGINSSTTYASRAVDTIRAGLTNGREFKVGMYGRQTLADVRGLPVAEPSHINQIPGELHEMYSKLLLLKGEITDQT